MVFAAASSARPARYGLAHRNSRSSSLSPGIASCFICYHPLACTWQVNSNAPIKDCHAVDANWDIEGALDAYEQAGVPMSKIVMGLATYGEARAAPAGGRCCL